MRISDWSSDVCSSDLGIAPHAPRSDVLRAVEAARAVDADLIVSIGGGSVIDATKIAALALKHDIRRVEDFEPLRTRVDADGQAVNPRSEEHTSVLQSLMRISYAVFCLKHKNQKS